MITCIEDFLHDPEIQCQEVKNFLKEIIQVCKKYNFSISHEDKQGAFEIKDYDDFYSNWLLNATDLTEDSEKLVAETF